MVFSLQVQFNFSIFHLRHRTDWSVGPWTGSSGDNQHIQKVAGRFTSVLDVIHQKARKYELEHQSLLLVARVTYFQNNLKVGTKMKSFFYHVKIRSLYLPLFSLYTASTSILSVYVLSILHYDQHAFA